MNRRSLGSVKLPLIAATAVALLAGAGCAHPPTRHGAAAPPSTSAAPAAPQCDPTASYQPTMRSATVASIAKRGFLVVGVSPLSRVGDLYQGFDGEMARVLARAIFPSAAANPDSRIKYKPITMAGRVKELQNPVNSKDINRGGVDIVVHTFTPTCEARQAVAFSAPYFAAGQRMVVGKGISAQKISELRRTDASGRRRNARVCVAKNTPSFIALSDKKKYPHFDLATPDYILDCPAMLEQGQVEAAASDAYLVTYFAAQNPSVRVLKEAFGPAVPYSFAVNKRTPDLAAFTNLVLAKIMSDGTWRKIYGGVFESQLGPQQPPKPNYGLGRAPRTVPVASAQLRASSPSSARPASASSSGSQSVSRSIPTARPPRSSDSTRNTSASPTSDTSASTEPG